MGESKRLPEVFYSFKGGMMRQISFCTYCNKQTYFEPVQISGYIRKAIEENPGIGRQLKFAINFLFLENWLSKKYTAFQCNNCGEVYSAIPDTRKNLLYIDYRNEKVIPCKVIAEYENHQYIASWIDGHEIIVSPDEAVNWFDDQQTAIEAYSYWLESQGKDIGGNIQHVLKALGEI